MSIFQKKPTVCTACRVYYEPDPAYDRWPDLCPVHRERPMARDRLRDAVLAWADVYWESLIVVMGADPDAAPGLGPLYQAARDAGALKPIDLGIEHHPPIPMEAPHDP